MKTVIETERLILREMNMDDIEALREVLSDRENMKYYPYFSMKKKSESGYREI